MGKITTQNDEYLKERWESKSRWHITLSDGTEVYQDDERAGRPSWLDLSDYLKEHPGLTIRSMYFGFRDNTVQLPDNADGYFFRYGLLASWGGFEKHSYIAGYLQDGVLTVLKYELPEMAYLGTETRNIEDAGPSLIVCKNEEKYCGEAERTDTSPIYS